MPRGDAVNWLDPVDPNGTWAGVMPQIWPLPEGPFLWPTYREGFTDEHFEILAKRWDSDQPAQLILVRRA